MSELGKLVEIGKSFGLEGKDLLEYVEKKEREKHERDERMQEREARQKLELLQMEIEIEKLKKENPNIQAESKVSAAFVRAKTPKLPPFDEIRDNIDAYLQRFERFAQSVGWEVDDWATNLSALLKGKALEVYSRLSPLDALSYDALKDALLKRFQMSEEGFRQKFRSCRPDPGETAVQFVVRLDNYLNRWIEMSKTDHSYDGLRDLLLKEQSLNASNKTLALILRERKPATSKEMASLADQYLEAHKGMDLVGFSAAKGQQSNLEQTFKPKRSNAQDSLKDRKCYLCGDKGHIAINCPNKSKRVQKVAGLETTKSQQTNCCHHQCQCSPDYAQPRKQFTRRFGNWKNQAVKDNDNTNTKRLDENQTAGGCLLANGSRLQECCTQDCHVTLLCGHEFLVVSAACEGNGNVKIVPKSNLPVTEGYIGSRKVSVLRDTGCSGIVVRKGLVDNDMLTGKCITCVLIDGTVRNVPVAEIVVSTPYFEGKTEAMCFENAIYDLIIGCAPGVNDTEHTGKISSKGSQESSVEEEVYKADNCVVGEECLESMAVETRAQKASKPFKALLVPDNNPGINWSRDDIIKAQQEDESLKRVRELCCTGIQRVTGKNNKSSFGEIKGLLYRKFQSGKIDHGNLITQLVVPKQLRKQVMTLGHECIFSGHLGAKKTTERILSQFYWPGLQDDVKRYCRSCDTCQRTFPKGKVSKVPLSEMPLIEEPFRRVAVDIVGPITPMTEHKNRFILVLVDYAARYPEAKALPSIETERVAEALVEMFSRVGVPREILSDQGSQFTSALMKEVGRLLSIKQITTTPYHPMCNGLVEKFNGTLKAMLKRLCVEKPSDWDRYLGAVLFAYREAPQDSLGFSPFELLYGRTVRGPMSILRELWTKEVEAPDVKTTYQYILDLRNILEDTCSMARKELKKSQVRNKHHFDRKARSREFKEEDSVLILLPTNNNKLLMQWQGPYNILEKVATNDYRIEIKDKNKVYHANMLKRYTPRIADDGESQEEKGMMMKVAAAVVIEDNGNTEDSDNGDLLQSPPLQVMESIDDINISSDLSESQRKEVKTMLKTHENILTDKPGKCNLAEHDIKLTSEEPIRSRPYPIPYALKETVRAEVQTMLDMGVIEPSSSPYAAPIVLVKKPDGSNRFCIDFRKLNSVTVFDAEPMPEEIFATISKSRVFTKIDLSKGYWQISVKEDCKPYTAFVTPDGLYQFSVMPFGLVNAPATFNRMMRILLKGMDHINSFLDDILLHTETWEDHVTQFAELLERLTKVFPGLMLLILDLVRS